MDYSITNNYNDDSNLKVKDSNSKSYKLLSSNFRGIRSKAESFTQLIISEKPNLISGTESWLNPSILNSEIFPLQYNVFRCDRSDGYGGVFFACDSSLSCTQLFLSTSVEAVASKNSISRQQILGCIDSLQTS